MRHNRGAAVGALARLRRATATEIGEDPSAWQIAFLGYPVPEDDRDYPSADEKAVYLTLTLFALHQQSKNEPMHEDGGPSLGTALSRLARISGSEDASDPVVRRFNALVTADSEPETRWHLRSLVGQLRAHDIRLDYGRLADDLSVLGGHHRRSESSDQARRRVQLRWSRDFSRAPKPDEESATGSASESATSTD
ncbi:type I-E CRISPR-associated protein Cse2/CasB [Dietzia sp. DQ11-71]|uniref:type I-E CRISPR-associated protein Cse2/CasB n=1 Tax=Dietzia sp. Alg238-R159 TaxID=2305986 RepID=UPI0013D7B43E|nr:type I-E CRISPR-associated protein Cse2/CasB [Dietzia sp. Alg238-R159]MBB1017419.1 type I-E CRISPR-associated protein Cse2/CasB [Dietzia sp. DQ11-71]